MTSVEIAAASDGIGGHHCDARRVRHPKVPHPLDEPPSKLGAPTAEQSKANQSGSEQ
jgi:hypothetical protein